MSTGEAGIRAARKVLLRAGIQKVLELRECRNSKSSRTQRVLELRRCWNSESAGTQKVLEFRECYVAARSAVVSVGIATSASA